MKNIPVVAISIFIYLLSVVPLTAQNSISSKYTIDALSVNNGLPVNFVDDIYKDRNGFIWVSTQGGGLSRYDGYELINLNVNSSPIALKSNFIRKTCEDNFNRLWAVSDVGIDIINLRTMQHSLMHSNEEMSKLLSIPMTSVIKDNNGNIWLTSRVNVYKITFESNGSIRKVWSTANESNSLEITTIDKVDSQIWIGYNGFASKVEEENDGKLKITPIDYLPKTRYIYRMLKKDNLLWIGTEDGLLRYDYKDNKTRIYTYNAKDPGSLSQNLATDLAIVNDSVLLVGTLKGLNFYNPATDSFEKVSHGKDNLSLTNDFINCILPDGNNLWIGTEAGGVNKMTLRKLAIQNYIHQANDRGSLSPNPVNAIHEDRLGNLWTGTVEGGLNLKRKGENTFIHYTMERGHLSHNSVSTLEEDNDGKLWIGTWGNGISRLNINKLPITNFDYIMPDGMNYIAILKYDSINNGMWIGSNRQIYFYDIERKQIIEPLPTNLTACIMGVLGCIIDNKKNLWMGTSNGLIVIDLQTLNKQTNTCHAKFLNLNNEMLNSLFLKNVTYIHQAKDGDVWLGSNGYGICRLTYKEGNYIPQIYTMIDGLANNVAYSILEDEQQMIWIGTGRGISCFNPETSRFVNYTKNDGLINDQFYWNAAYKSPTNHNLYFGSMGGLTELKGSREKEVTEQRKITFTKLQILNETVWYNNNKYIQEDISYAKRLELHEQDKSFSIEFSALDYENPSTVMYSYRLLGFDDKWVSVRSNRRFVSYTNLSPGTYTLQVRCMTKAYDWSNNITEMEIVIRPYFYKTTWFISLCVALLGFMGFRLYRWRISSLKKQREMLHKKVEERTLALESQKKLLEEQAEELKMQNETLISQNEKISHQRQQLIVMADKVQEAMTDKISFFTNITHEFRTPITLIIGPIERALKLSSNSKVIEQLQYVARNSKHLLSLVNQLMDFRKVESDNITIEPTAGNIIKYLDELLIPFESFARERNISIERIYRLEQPYIMFDEEAMHKLITNLLSNAIKFTPDNGVVRLYVSAVNCNRREQQEKLYICVQDSGTGIREEDLNRIFDRFYQSKGNDKYPIYGQSGTGIGLYLCKTIVNLQNGTISAKNNPMKGASFRVVLPLEYTNEKEIVTYDDEDETIPNPMDVNEIAPINNQQLTLLVVEDNNDMRKYISSILNDHYKVIEAENGEEALKVLKNEQIDFIISDLMMPVMDGMELSKRVKADIHISHIPFLMLTAKTSLETRINSYKTGVDEFLAKPFDEELLLARIRNILESRRTYQRKFSLHMDMDELNIAEESYDEKFLRKALQVVKENYRNTNYEVGDFSEAMGVSKSLLNKKMQMLTGESPNHFIRNFRLNIARELIEKSKGNMQISEIAYEVGFNDAKYFTRCFTRHFGVAPSKI